MKSWWVKFTDGTAAGCSGESDYDAKIIAEKLTGKTVSGEKFEPDIKPLPYPCRDMIWQYEHPAHGKTPPFCYSPAKCAGRTACPTKPSCCD